jgi:phage tail sheath protein FI
MTRPGVNIAIRSTPPARIAPTDTGVWFLAGLTEKGSVVDPVLVTSLAEVEQKLGARVSYGLVYDALDVFFHEGGVKAYVARVVGAANVTAQAVLNDAGAAPTFIVKANSPGEWGNSLNIVVTAGTAGGTFVLTVTHDVLGTLEVSPDLLDKAAAFAWAQNSGYIVLVDQASLNDPAVVAAVSLSGGLDNQAGIVDADWTASLTRFSRTLGPGQVSFPGRTTTVAHAALQAHAAANNRVAILDAQNVANTGKATLLTALTNVRANGRWSAMFWPWDVIPGVVQGVNRTVPPSGRIAGNIARVDAKGSPNKPAAGESGQSSYALSLSQSAFIDADREQLNAAGLDISVIKYGGVRTYGWRSVADPSADAGWVNFGNSRLVMEIAAKADQIGETFIFSEIDGQGILAGSFGAALTGMLMPYWTRGSLYGVAPNEAFVVDVGPSVNTPTTIGNLELRAVIGLRASPFAEMITVEIVKSQVTQNL